MDKFQISPYAIAFLSSLVVSFLVAFFAARKRGLPANIIGYTTMLNLMLVLSGAKMYMVFVSGFKMSLLNSGIASMGGVIGLFIGIITMGFIYPEGRRDIFESYALVIPLLYSIAKIGCHMAGCCQGISYEGIFSISYNNDFIKGGPYFPVQMTETIVFFLIFLIGCYLFWGKESRYLMPVMMILCGVAKASIEFLREEHVGKIITPNQIFCLLFMVGGVVLILMTKRKGISYEKYEQ